ncbi:MAG: prepilin-type N-terminal cleavage/methylation domain-containing protein [Planctomycetota bacterium]|nr:prepilin-type N-terminal cleavage/methylation domain-containing protein [Planctomycetota bacterium]
MPWARPGAGFTLLEMMVTVAICLMMMAMVVPVFQVVTRSTSRIERKLAVHEAARMVLDFYDAEIQSAVYDSRGNHFGIKSVAYDDGDSFTPAGAATRYGHSQRHGSELSYLRMPSFSANTAYASHDLGMALFNYSWDEDVNLVALGHVLASSDYAYERAGALADVSQGRTTGYLSRAHYRATSAGRDMPAKALGPGFEWGAGGLCDDEAGHGRGLSALDVVDFEVAYWDDAARAFKNLPDFTAVYFAPPPKAIRITVTVADANKRETLTFSRITRVPGGTASGALPSGAPDASNTDPSPYNRLKDLKALYPWRGY